MNLDANRDAQKLLCALCRTPVDWDDAVATRADEVVHARCHPIVATLPDSRPDGP